ncbi:MarR family winged helix-turn-helix transcriptional regulator [Gordonia soli]|uniref:Putative MarR family transcriptional regulator n=1 Tax=Gordonia soli NBRC 108243 TaxID=1223545 RepID=M0QGG3_9ACTN|nr:MarR family winged helix-turn-helix transcriptional regulator [Gordonia soli]GAC67720.1 putative MarR family transcriptional regulator [Gordonia soli NBRC 108243]
MSARPDGGDASLSEAEQAVWRQVVDGGWGLLAVVNESMARSNLSPADLRVLEALDASTLCSISELAGRTHIRLSTLSRHVARLIDEGSVERVSSPVDGRHRLVRVTDHGRDVLREHVKARDILIRQHVIDVLSDEDFESLGRIFGRIADNL